MNSASSDDDSRDRRLHRGGLRGIPQGPRRALLARSTAAARRSPGSRRSPGRARATRNGGGPISGPSSSTPSRPPAPERSLRRVRRRASIPSGQTLSSHYATGIEHVNGAAVRARRSGQAGRGASFVDLDQAVKDHPELLRRYLLTEAVKPADDIFAALHAAFWTGGTLLYVPRGVKVEAPLFSLVGLADEGRVDLSHTLVVLEEGAEATLVRETARPRPRRAPRAARRGPRGRPGPGLRFRLVNIQNWDAVDLALQPRACPRGPRRVDPVDRRRPGLAAGEGQPGSRAGGPGGRGPGQRRHVHHRPPAPGLLHPAGPHRPAHHAATCSTRGASRTARGSSGRG